MRLIFLLFVSLCCVMCLASHSDHERFTDVEVKDLDSREVRGMPVHRCPKTHLCCLQSAKCCANGYGCCITGAHTVTSPALPCGRPPRILNY